jgi:biopolymer transport protein ExbB/TolQ
MSNPQRVLPWMLAFLAAVAVLAALLATRLGAIFAANPFFNGVILAVLAAGVVVNLRQIFVLSREVAWIEAFRRSNPDQRAPGKPHLLAPMARMLDGRDRGRAALSAPSMRTILDSVQLRLEESRDLSRYLIGLAIFLGLLGTFWGLLVTIRSVSDIIGTLNVGNDAVTMFGALKENLREPLGGMSTSFSTSLFGLASSLVIGFLDLQAGHAQNRFYNELEEWLSGMTRLSSGSSFEADASVPAYVQALLEQTADGLDRMQRAIVEAERERHGTNQQLGELGAQLGRLADLLGRDARERHAAAETQEELKTVLRQLAAQKPSSSQLSDELRAELRLLSRTIAAALDGQRSRTAAPEAGPMIAEREPRR